ncbi:MAG: 30S ribosomal protein S6e [Nanoarchaeota archaeon]|nr:30S ribosomal protein S6e [Nanoarchaeota archaeon]
MTEFKLVIADPKTGKCSQREVKDQDASFFLGKKIKDVVKGEALGLQGYEFEITGGSDDCGFPMRYDVSGSSRKKILAISGVGLKKKEKGVRQRKTVCGNAVHEKISQINLKILKIGKEPLEKAPEEEAKPEAEEKPAEKAAEEKPKEEAKEEKAEEKPAKEEKKEEKSVKEEKPEEKKE